MNCRMSSATIPKISAPDTLDQVEVLNGYSDLFNENIVSREENDLPFFTFDFKKLGNMCLDLNECLSLWGKHFDVSLNAIDSLLNILLSDTYKEIQIRIGIDGLAKEKSSKNDLWPILGAFYERKNVQPFPIGAYYGRGKSKTDAFLQEYADEAAELEKHGILLSNGVRKPVKVILYSLDSPAKALCKGCKHHSGYDSCTFCNQRAMYLDGHRAFEAESKQLRSDRGFRKRIEPEHHNELSPVNLEKVIGTDMIWDFPVDMLHYGDLGTTKTFVTYVIGNHVKMSKAEYSEYRINASKLEEISQIYITFREFIPVEFA